LKKPTKTIGDEAENLALAFLQKKGLCFIAKQYRTKFGEIDLIMQDKNELVFVEVRFRARTDFGFAEETVAYHKQQRLIRTALCFQGSHFQWQEMAARFDIVAISGRQPNYDVHWITDPFGIS